MSDDHKIQFPSSFSRFKTALQANQWLSKVFTVFAPMSRAVSGGLQSRCFTFLRTSLTTNYQKSLKDCSKTLFLSSQNVHPQSVGGRVWNSSLAFIFF